MRYWDGTAWGPVAPPTPPKKKSDVRQALLIVMSVLAVLAVVGGLYACGAYYAHHPEGSGAPTRTVTVSTPAAAAGPRSRVAAITLPAGSKSVGNLPSHMELWAVPASYDFTVQALREQLPIGRDYQGLKWCSQEITDAHTEWDWGDSKDMLDITVSTIVGSLSAEARAW